MRTEYNPDHYQTPRTLPHSGNAIEGPESHESLISTLWAGACIVCILLGVLMVWESFK